MMTNTVSITETAAASSGIASPDPCPDARLPLTSGAATSGAATSGKRNPAIALRLLTLWHAWLSGSFLVAWLTADEDTWLMHQFSGYAVLAAVAVRLMAGLLLPSHPLWRLPRWHGRGLRGWLAVSLFAGVAAVSLSGVLAENILWLEHPHEALAEAFLQVIAAHIIVGLWLSWGHHLPFYHTAINLWTFCRKRILR